MGRYTDAVLTVIAACLVWICVRDLPLWPREARAGEAEPGAQIVRASSVVAESFTLVTKDGKKAADWQCVKGEPNLTLYSARENAQAALSIEGGRPHLALVFGRSRTDIGWYKRAVDLPEITMRDMTGREFWGVPRSTGR